MNLCFKLGKGLFASLRHAANPVDARHGSPRTVHDALRMKNFLDEFNFSLIKNLMEVSPHQLLVNRELVFGASMYSHRDSMPCLINSNRERGSNPARHHRGMLTLWKPQLIVPASSGGLDGIYHATRSEEHTSELQS